MADKVSEEVVPRFVHATGVCFPGTLQFFQVDTARAIEEAVGEAGEGDGAGDGGRMAAEGSRMEVTGLGDVGRGPS